MDRDEPRHVDIRGWRYGPRWLRVDDDEWIEEYQIFMQKVRGGW